MAEVDTSMYRLPEHKSPFARANEAATLLNTLESNKLLQTQVELEGLKLSMEQTDGLRRAFNVIATKKGDVSAKDFSDIIQTQIDLGQISPERAAVFASQLPTDPTKLRDFAREQAFMAQTIGDQMAQLYDRVSIETGGGTLTANRNIYTGEFGPGGGMFTPRQMSPGELAAPQSTVGEDGVPRNVTMQEFLEGRGAAPAGGPPPITTGIQPGQVPGNELSALGGAPPEIDETTGLPAATPAEVIPLPDEAADEGGARTAAAPEGGYATGLPPGEQEAMSQAATVYNEAVKQMAGYNRRVFPVEQALDIIDAMPDDKKATTFGPTSETWNELSSALTTLGISQAIEDATGIKLNDVDTDAEYQEVRKYLTQYVQQQAASVGGPNTDQGLATTIMGSPNVHLSGMALEDLIKTQLAVERYNQAKIMAFEEARQAEGLPANSYPRWAARFDREHDIRSFALDLSKMTPAQMAKWYDGLSDAEKARVDASLQLGNRLGLMREPD